jgi:tetratricopeptide (TPR) repeat protein
MDPWPVSGGRDLSWYKNHDFGADHSHFVMGTYAHYFGGYWHDLKFGFGHYALYSDMPGKKMWIWSLARRGAIWEDLLTDSDGQYSEPQAGRLLSQDDHEFFEPYTADHWEETFFPFKETGGISDASPKGVLHVKRVEDSLSVFLCALEKLNEKMTVTIDRETHIFPVKLNPMDIYRVTLPIAGPPGRYSVDVGKLLTYSSDTPPPQITRPLSYDRINESTPEGLYLAGEFHHKRRQYREAVSRYTACLEKEPQHIRAMCRLAELHVRSLEYDDALQMAANALTLDKYHADANYQYGIIARRLGRYTDAKETLGWAARSMKYRSNALCQLAEIAIIEKDHSLAQAYGEKALLYNAANVRALEVSAIIQRLSGKVLKATAILDRLEAMDPLNHFVRFERFLLQPAEPSRNDFLGMIRNEFPHETCLELAALYAGLGLEADLLKILETGPQTVMTMLWQAYFQRSVNPVRSRELLKQAGAQDIRLVFPFREESLPVLEWAAAGLPGSWKMRYLLALLLWHHGQLDRAEAHLLEVKECDFAPYYLVMAHLFPENATAHTQKARETAPGEWRTWHMLIRNQLRHAPERALSTARKANKRFKSNMALSMDLASAYYSTGHYRSCLSVLKDLEVLPYEGGWEAHHLYVSAHLKTAMKQMTRGAYKQALESLEASTLYPEHLGTGEPFDADRRIQDYLSSLCYRRLGDAEEAGEAEEAVLSFTLAHWANAKRNNFFSYLVLQKSGMAEKAQALRQAWRESGNPLYHWYEALLIQDGDTASTLGQKLMANPRHEIICAAVKFASTFAE